MRLRFFILAATYSCLWAQAQDSHSSAFFVPNEGQWEAPASFKSDLAGGALFLEKNTLTYHFIDQESVGHAHDAHEPLTHKKGHAFQWRFKKAKRAKLTASKQLKGTVNFFKGQQSYSGLGRFQQIHYQGVYPQIDYRLYAYGSGLKYDWIVAPGGNPRDIQLELIGAEASLKDGRLHIRTTVNEVIEEAPYAYQWVQGEKVTVPCQFVWKRGQLSFAFPEGYNKNLELVIDPVLIFSSYSGSTANNFGYTATYDDYGFLYAGGTAFDLGYPTTLGAYETSYSGGVSGPDIVLTKYDTSGTFMVYSTYLGGSGDEVPHSLIVYNDELYMMGTSGSNDFPTTIGCWDASFNSGVPILVNGVGLNFDQGCDIVVSRLSTDGTQLLASTYLGGSGNDGFNTAAELRYNYADQMRGEIDFDTEGNCYIASTTQSNDFPIVNSLIQPAINGEQDGVVVKIDINLSTIEWSTYWGGTNNDAIYSLAFNAANDIYVCGGSRSVNLETTPNAYAPTYLGGTVDAFISQMAGDGSTLINSSYFGSDAYDQAYFIELDKTDSVYIYGQTNAPDSTLIENALFSQPNSGQFIAKFSPDLSTKKFSTVFGSGSGGIDISPTAFLVDVCNQIYCSGWGGATNSPDLGGPGGFTTGLFTTPGAFQSTTDGSDLYLLIMEDNANALSYATFFGGNQATEHVDGGTSRFDKKGVVYQSVCAGCGGFSDFPTTDGAVSSTNNASCNNAVFKFDPDLPLTIAQFNAPDLSCEQTLLFENLSLGDNNTYSWNFGDGNTSNDFSPTHTFLAEGSYDVSLVSSDPTSCNLSDTITKTVRIRANQYETLDSLKLCLGDSVLLDPPFEIGITYNWSPTTYLSDPNIINPFATPEDTILYTLVGNIENCADTFLQHIAVREVGLSYQAEVFMCGLPVLLSAVADSGVSFVWSEGANFDKPQGDSIWAGAPGTYYVMASQYGCEKTGSLEVRLNPSCCSEDKIIIPNAFSPNGDQLNDSYLIQDPLNLVAEFELHIYNRWGQEVFLGKDKKMAWDGSFKGESLAGDVFDYYLDIGCIGGQEHYFRKGNITLIR